MPHGVFTCVCRCSIFNMFDSCLLLGSDGNVVYSGPQRLAQSYMAFLGFYIPPNENLADFLLDVTSGKQDSSDRRQWETPIMQSAQGIAGARGVRSWPHKRSCDPHTCHAVI
jgi:hypothetical protein